MQIKSMQMRKSIPMESIQMKGIQTENSIE